MRHNLKQRFFPTCYGIQFAGPPRNRSTIYSGPMRFDMICEANGIKHRPTKTNHPLTHGQVGRMSRTIKKATVKRCHYDTHSQLEMHPSDFIAACDYARRLKTLQGLTPLEDIRKIRTNEPVCVNVNPTDLTLRPTT